MIIPGIYSAWGGECEVMIPGICSVWGDDPWAVSGVP